MTSSRIAPLEPPYSEPIAAALGRIPGRESLQALLSAYEATRGAGSLLLPALREKVSAALREREGEIVEYLFESDPPARPLLFKALWELKTPGAIAAMVRALDEGQLRDLARHFLARIAKKDLGPRPEAWSRWLGETGGGEMGRKENS